MKKVIILILINVFYINITFSQKQRITGGYDLTIENAPYQVLLKENNEYICGGSIISSQYILTAKHCCVEATPSNLKVIVGVTCKEDISDNNIYSVSEIILHPNLDVALLRLSQKINFDNSKQPINFVNALNTSFYNVGNSVRVSGWGWLTPNGHNPANCLQAVDVNIISNESANQMLSDIQDEVGDDEVATTGIGTVREGACHGDSGGPLVIWSEDDNEYVLLGVVSWGRANCVGDNLNSPSIYVRVNRIVPWIIEKTYSISGSSTLCDQETYTIENIENLPSGATVTWSASNDNVQLVSGQGTGTAVFSKQGNGKTTINATVHFSTNNISLEGLNVWCGKPSLWLSHTPVSYYNPNFTVNIHVQPYQEFYNLGTFHWEIIDKNGNTYTTTTTNPYIHFNDYVFRVKLSTNHTCGTLIATKRILMMRNSRSSIFPNPVNQNEVVNIQLESNKNHRYNVNGGTPYKIQLWSSFGMVKEIETDQEKYQLSLQGIPAGFYYVHIIKGKEVIRKQLIVK